MDESYVASLQDEVMEVELLLAEPRNNLASQVAYSILMSRVWRKAMLLKIFPLNFEFSFKSSSGHS